MGVFEDAQRERESELAQARSNVRALEVAGEAQRDAIRQFVDAMARLGCAPYDVRVGKSGKRDVFINGWRIDNSSRSIRDIYERSDSAILAGDVQLSLNIDRSAERFARDYDFIVTPDMRLFGASVGKDGKSVRAAEVRPPVALRLGFGPAVGSSADTVNSYGETLDMLFAAYTQEVMRSGYAYGRVLPETSAQKQARLVGEFKDRVSVVLPGALLTIGILWIASKVVPTQSAHSFPQTYLPDFGPLFVATILSSLVAIGLVSVIGFVQRANNSGFYAGFLVGVLIFMVHLPWSKLDNYGGQMFSVASWWIAPMLAVVGYLISAVVVAMRVPIDARTM